MENQYWTIRDLRGENCVEIWNKSKLCCVLPDFQTCPPCRSEHSGSSGGPMNLLPPQDWFLLNKLAGSEGLQGFTRVALFGFGGLVERNCTVLWGTFAVGGLK